MFLVVYFSSCYFGNCVEIATLTLFQSEKI